MTPTKRIPFSRCQFTEICNLKRVVFFYRKFSRSQYGNLNVTIELNYIIRSTNRVKLTASRNENKWREKSPRQINKTNKTNNIRFLVKQTKLYSNEHIK